MNRVLLFWRIGTGSVYIYVSKIDNDYIIPPNANGVIFYEGIIVKESREVNGLVIELPDSGQTLNYDENYRFKAVE